MEKIIKKLLKILQEEQMSNEASSFSIIQIAERNTIFEIPPYQRLYEWEEEQIKTLLEDVKKAQEEQKDIYFIGNVVVSQQNGKYILIDGQQRLTTLFLIGVYLASRGYKNWEKFVKNDKQIRISMPLRKNEEKGLSELIDKDNKTDKDFEGLSKKKPEIQYKITKALEVIAKWFRDKFQNGNKTSNNDLESYSRYLYGVDNKGVHFALVELAEGTDLNQFFVRMNNRGKQLEKHEILKARLLKVLQGDGTDVWKKYAKIWDLCSDMDKYIFQSASDRKFILSNTGNSVPRKNEPTLSCILNNKLGDLESDGLDASRVKDIERVKSIIDFSTFLLHTAKLYGATELAINKDKLLDLIVVDKDSNGSAILSLKKEKEEETKEEVKKFILAVLTYRVLFDYFVIKHIVSEDTDNNKEYSIRCLKPSKKNDNTYYSIGGVVMEKLAMIQNYLRVARAGDKQNYHHWLAPFLKKVSMDVEIKEKVKKICSAILNSEVDIEAFNQIKKSDDFCVEFLEGLDRDLAYAQMGWKSEEESGSNINDSLLFVTNRYLGKNNGIKWKKEVEINNWLQKNLNQGTGTPHYWFYRLEYYLWKGNEMNKQTFDGKKFGGIKQNFRFRGLNSVEHIQPQSKIEGGDWQDEENAKTRKIDCFGNLALVSQSFNSSLSNQDTGDKILDLRKKVNKDDVESLKLWLVYSKIEEVNDKWNYYDDGGENTAVKHQEEMIQILSDSLKPQKK